jgi:CubicO group peptidase (beta-lactamase class C family)
MCATLCALLLASCVTESHRTAEHSRHAKDPKGQELETLLRGIVDNHSAAGVSWAYKIGNARPEIGSYGVANLETHRPLRPADPMRIASLTKPLTATAVMKLVEMRRLSLADPLSKFFPNYPGGRAITIYELLSHTSGIPNWWDGELPPDTPVDFPMCPEPHRYLARMKVGSQFEPGTAYKYSNSGYVLLGEIIEQASGEPYEYFLRRHVFAQARMANTSLERNDRPTSNWVFGYVQGPDTKTFKEPERYHMPFAAGGLRSTAEEMFRFVEALREGKIISRKAVDQMTSYAQLNDGRLTFEAPFLAQGAPKPKVQEHIAKRGYGLGFNVMELHGTSVYFHSGGIAGFNAYLIHIPRTDTTFVAIANTEDALVPVLKDLLRVVAG